MTQPAPELVTFGETMALLTNTGVGPLRHASTLRVGVGGAESNTAIGLSRLGGRAAWMGRVGADEFGALVLAPLRGEGLDVQGATVDDEAPTGLHDHREPVTTAVSGAARAMPAAQPTRSGELGDLPVGPPQRAPSPPAAPRRPPPWPKIGRTLDALQAFGMGHCLHLSTGGE